MNKLYPLILCGGSGTRLWPLSRALHPKQFMDVGGYNLFGNTLKRCRALQTSVAFRALQTDTRIETPLVVCNEEHRFYAAANLHEQNFQSTLLLEPVGRNTAPAIALGAFQALELCGLPAPAEADAPDADPALQAANAPLLLVLPADHSIRQPEVLFEALGKALPSANQGWLVTFGIQPTEASTAFGYINAGTERRGPACLAVRSFQEKPAAAVAQALLEAGDCFWNSGIFLLRADLYLAELRRHAPAIHEAVRAAWDKRQQDRDFLRPDKEIFSACPADSIDYAIMEHTERAALMPVPLHWNDLGSWKAFYQLADKDEANNACIGDVLTENSRNCYLHSSHRLVAALGLDDLAVIETADAVLVAKLDQVEEVKHLVARLGEEGRQERDSHLLVHRPWGSYESLALDARFQIKRITVKPGAELSLQKHHHRSEHWVVVAGTAEVTVGEELRLLAENESVYIAIGEVHKLKNPGILPLVIVEVQSGSYLGEDDIIRIADVYKRI